MYGAVRKQIFTVLFIKPDLLTIILLFGFAAVVDVHVVCIALLVWIYSKLCLTGDYP